MWPSLLARGLRRVPQISELGIAALLVACSPGTAAIETTGGAASGGNGSGGSSGTLGSSSGGEGTCVADKLEAQLVKEPVDIIMAVDTSWTMAPAISAVQAQLNTSLTNILQQSGIDYRLILIAGYDAGSSLVVCIEPPLGGAPCNPLPSVPANTTQFFQYAQLMGSGLLPGELLTFHSAPDMLNTAPSGYSMWLRPEAFKVFVVISDTSSTAPVPSLGDDFDNTILAMQPPLFGTPGNRRYTMHSIIGLAEKPNPTEPHQPTEPIVSALCSGYGGAIGAGEAVQQVSILSGGLRFPMCQFQSFDVVFSQIAAGHQLAARDRLRHPVPHAAERRDHRSHHR